MTATKIRTTFTLAIAALALLFAASSIPSRDVARAESPAVSKSAEPDPSTPEGDPADADNWRYCSVDGFLAAECGGTTTSCPPGTMMSRVTWVGTCLNPADGKDYIVSYNDCCGKGPCGRSFVHRNEGDKPVYYAHKSNDVGWCMGEADAAYNSTVSIVLGVAEEPDH
jgi:methylamine dehydrogenase light chain